MYRVLVLFLLTLSHCHLSNVSASDFPEIFSSGVNTYATLDSYTIDSDNNLSYKISIYHKYNIQKVVVSGATSGEEVETSIGGSAYCLVDGKILLSADDNPKHIIYVTIYSTTGDKVVLSFTITATI